MLFNYDRMMLFLLSFTNRVCPYCKNTKRYLKKDVKTGNYFLFSIKNGNDN